ncbi:MAG: hypothetical protein M1834_008679 [Cirrosporium novae-zelandiae]|nr:MAG: hypothetical protein M1834_008679 [Cirrosporium novae-zelandiae]
MATTTTTNALPLTRDSVLSAHALIKPFVHRTPVITSHIINALASTPQSPTSLVGTRFSGKQPTKPKINVFFKCENFQRVGAFKSRGAFHALSRLGDEEVKKGVVTHSSGNHAQALALAARTRGIPAYIVMPSISTPSKIAATQGYGANVIFSGSTSQEREAVVAEVIKKTGALLIPPYDHPNIILGQGTTGLELEEQVKELVAGDSTLSVHSKKQGGTLDAVISPCGGGGLLSGLATAFSPTLTLVFGSEPSFQGADDARRSLHSNSRIDTVKTLTIADGLRTPLGEIPWSVITATPAGLKPHAQHNRNVEDIFTVTEQQIKDAMRLLLERVKIVVEPSSAVPLAVILFNEEFRALVEKEGGEEGWDVGVILSGGNTSIEAISRLFAEGESDGNEGDKRN